MAPKPKRGRWRRQDREAAAVSATKVIAGDKDDLLDESENENVSASANIEKDGINDDAQDNDDKEENNKDDPDRLGIHNEDESSATVAEAPPSSNEEPHKKQRPRSSSSTSNASPQAVPGDQASHEDEQGGNKGRENGSDAHVANSPPTQSQPPSSSSAQVLILTSDKRRGVYECDYCHADISQVPRISCAVCQPEFDLCLDCFATTDHSAAIARLKNLERVHDAVTAQKTTPHNRTTTPGVSKAAVKHEMSHGYRVADSTRYALFPATRSVNTSIQTTTATAPTSSRSLSVTGAPTTSMEGVEEERVNTNGQQRDSMNKDDLLVNGAKIGEVTRKELVDEETKIKTTVDSLATNDEPHQVAPRVDDMKQVADDATNDGRDGKLSTKSNNDDNESRPAVSTEDGSETISGKKRPLFSSSSSSSSIDDTTATMNSNNNKYKREKYMDMVLVQDDPKSAWTVEEDLRLLDAIETCGLGNWADIAEAITSNGSNNKSAKRCMERYFDDFLGRYGHILPPYTVVEQEEAATVVAESDTEDGDNTMHIDDNSNHCNESDRVDPSSRPSKRRLMRSSSQNSCSSGGAFGRRRNIKVVPTSSLPGYNDSTAWPKSPYLPPLANIKISQDVGREQTLRAENAYVKTLATATTGKEAEQMRHEWMEHRIQQHIQSPYPPHVLPPRLEDVADMPGSELAGFMPRRGDFDMEWDNDAENIIADMEFSPNDLPQDRQLKIQVIEVYNAKLDERERRKNFLLSRNLLDYRKNQQRDQHLPSDERDLMRRMRLFERLHTPREHKYFVEDLLKAKRLRKEIAKLQMYRRMGITTLSEAERYELDKNRREFHKIAQLQKEQESKKLKEAAAKVQAQKEAVHSSIGAIGDNAFASSMAGSVSSSLWKQYKTSGRKERRSVNRTGADAALVLGGDAGLETTSSIGDLTANEQTGNDPIGKGEGTSPNAIDLGDSNIDGLVEIGSGDSTQVSAKGKLSEAAEQNSRSSCSVVIKAVATSTNTTRPAPSVTFNIGNSRGYELLASKEVALCEKLQLLPAHYLEIKKALVQESLRCGLLDNEGGSNNKRTIVKIDAEKRGDIVDFMLRAGWISSKVQCLR